MLFVCGEGPGEVEEQTGGPFAGKSGEWINGGLGAARGELRPESRLWPPFEKPTACDGCPLKTRGGPFVPGAAFGDALWIGNVRRCRCDDETPAEKAASIRHCIRAYLVPELARAAPRAIVLIGGDALLAITGLDAMQRYHGSVWRREEIDAVRGAMGVAEPALPPTLHTVVATIHPAFAMRVGLPQLKPAIVLAVARARRWSERIAGPTRDWEFDLEPAPEQLYDYLMSADATLESPVAVDFEWIVNDDDSYGEVEIAGFSARDGHAMVVEWKEPFVEIVRLFLRRRGAWKAGHNFSADRTAIAPYDCPVAQPIWDTILGAALLNPAFKEAEKHAWLNLPTCALRLIDGMFNWKPPKNKSDERGRAATWAMYRAAYPGVPEFRHAKLYNAFDNVMTRLLARAQRAELQREGML